MPRAVLGRDGFARVSLARLGLRLAAALRAVVVFAFARDLVGAFDFGPAERLVVRRFGAPGDRVEEREVEAERLLPAGVAARDLLNRLIGE